MLRRRAELVSAFQDDDGWLKTYSVRCNGRASFNSIIGAGGKHSVHRACGYAGTVKGEKMEYLEILLMFVKAFAVGGLICTIAQIVINFTDLTAGKILVVFMVAGNAL